MPFSLTESNGKKFSNYFFYVLSCGNEGNVSAGEKEITIKQILYYTRKTTP
jgi:hypothetical protein